MGAVAGEFRMTLEAYLSDQYNRDIQDVSAIEDLLASIATTFRASYDPAEQSWPYELRAGIAPAAGECSQGTTAMILSAVGKMYGLCSLPDGAASRALPKLRPKDIVGIFDSALEFLAQDLSTRGVRSGTFGEKNPL